jgi:hypothetical protein
LGQDRFNYPNDLRIVFIVLIVFDSDLRHLVSTVTGMRFTGGWRSQPSVCKARVRLLLTAKRSYWQTRGPEGGSKCTQ